MDSLARRWIARFLLAALAAAAVTVMSGMLASLTYTRHEPVVRNLGLTLQHLRPLHETFAFAWVFLGGVAVVLHYLWATHGLDGRDWRRIARQYGLWVAAGVGIVVSTLGGRFTGREYLGVPPMFAILVLAGWLLFARTYFGREGARLRGKPAYVYMWSIAIPLFVVVYVEAHLYLVEWLSRRPLRDLAFQWKSNGVLVGSFNQIAYGALMYVSGRIHRDDSYARSTLAFGLLFVGVLNTFTNYGHHTYHLPQSVWIHWIAFLVSMLEIVILAKLAYDLLRVWRAEPVPADLRVSARFAASTTGWTFAMLAMALAISVPPFNALIHGTHVVVAHAMGSTIGIDTMILGVTVSWLVREIVGRGHPAVSGRRVLAVVPALNLSLAIFLSAFVARGVAEGSSRVLGASAPDFSRLIQHFPAVMVVSGWVLAACLLWILGQWGVALWAPAWGRDSVPIERAGFAQAGAAPPRVEPAREGP